MISNVDEWIIRRTTFNYRVARNLFRRKPQFDLENNTINRE